MTEKPISGKYLERHYTCSEGKNVWVLFSGEGFKPWVGVFGEGSSPYFSFIAQFDETNIFLIIACGQGYIVNGADGLLIRRTKWDYSFSCFIVPERPFIAVANNQEVWACHVDKDIYATVEKPWFTNVDKSGNSLPPAQQELFGIALDGLVFDSISDNKLYGKSWWPPGWYRFQINLNNMSASIEKGLVNAQWDAFVALPDRGGFPFTPDYMNNMAKYSIY